MRFHFSHHIMQFHSHVFHPPEANIKRIGASNRWCKRVSYTVKSIFLGFGTKEIQLTQLKSCFQCPSAFAWVRVSSSHFQMGTKNCTFVSSRNGIHTPGAHSPPKTVTWIAGFSISRIDFFSDQMQNPAHSIVLIHFTSTREEESQTLKT